ncbi:MAG: hypothetical protein PHR71_07280 [Polaromonas sp.]|nr:hypothetical protein [Polaromonas sp.]
MSQSLPSHFIDLVRDALLKSFWRKPTFRQFLSRHRVKDTFLATIATDETKRETLDRLFPKLEKTEEGQQVIKQMAVSLSEQIAFPDLMDWEDEALKVRGAKEAVANLKKYVSLVQDDEAKERERQTKRKSAQNARQQLIAKAATVESLASDLTELVPFQGTQDGGYKFQDWFYRLSDFFEVECRRPYTTGGRQIDGTITVEGTTYLVELKFTASQSDATDIDSLLAKLGNVADNTMGLMVSMSGYSSVAVTQASGKKTPLILLNASHVMSLLYSGWKLGELVARLRRHVSQTGEAFLEVVGLHH